eukprot:jgi/Astpho2/1959/Aster-x0510
MLLAAKQGRSAEDGLMAIVLPMLIETASPAGQPNAALVDAAVKLIMHLAAGPSAAAFKVAVGALSVEGKRRLQAALKLSSAAQQSSQPAGRHAAKQKKPTIALKSFAIAVPKAQRESAFSGTFAELDSPQNSPRSP